MNLTERERAMEFAQKEGYRAYPYGSMPFMYNAESAKHLKEAWKAGWNQKRDENRW